MTRGNAVRALAEDQNWEVCNENDSKHDDFGGTFSGTFCPQSNRGKTQILSTPSFNGTFTLPNAVQWGRMTLPAGEYTLSYGQAFNGGTHIVAVTSKADGPTGMALVKANSAESTRNGTLVCIRQDDALVIRALEMPQIHTAARFGLPHAAQFVVHNREQEGYTQLAEAPMLIQRISVAPIAK